MSDPSREAFLARVRQAVRDGNSSGSAAPLPERGNLGRQGSGDDPVAHFAHHLEAAGGKAHVVPDDATARLQLFDLLASFGVKKVLLGSGPVLDRLKLSSNLTADGYETTRVTDLTAETARAAFFAAEVGITGATHLIAETGSIVVETGAFPRSESLLPPIHVVVADVSQLVEDLFDLFADPKGEPPACRTLITGPSKTGDIELKLVTGVHGPGEVHVILIGSEKSAKPLAAERESS